MKTIDKSLFFLLVILAISCDSENTDSPQPVPDTFEGIIALGGEPESFPSARTQDTLSVQEPQSDDQALEVDGKQETQRWVCTEKTLSVTDGTGKYPLFNSQADVIYPGALLQGKTLSDATPAPIVVKRAGGVVSYDLNNGNIQSTFRVDSVQKGAIQQAMNNIISTSGDVVPAAFQLEIEEVNSEEELALEIGLKVKTFTTQVKSNMAFSQDKRYNRFLVKLTQSYYTMSYDLPTSEEEIFHPSVKPEQLALYVQEDNPPTFVSSVTYGRIFYMLVESTASSSEMRANLDVSYGAFKNKAEGEVDVESFKSLSNLKIKVIAYGGDSKGAFEIAGERSVEDIAGKLAESTDIRAGKPLSYVARSVARPDQIVGTNLSTEYTIVDCELKGIHPPTGYQSLLDLFEDGFGAMIHIANSNVVFYNKAGTQYAWYNGNSGQVLGTFSIDDANGPLGASSFENIGAGVRFLDNRLYIFDGTGLQTETFSYEPGQVSGNSLPSGPIGSYVQANGANRVLLVNDIFGDSGNFQFAGRGFQAATRIGAVKMKYFGTPGEEYAIYDRSGNGSWDSPRDNSQWVTRSKGGKLFDRIGAASVIQFGGSSGRWLYINEAGDQLLEWYSLPVGEEKYEGPWVIN